MNISATGTLEIVCGSMYSGKSWELMRRLSRDLAVNKKVVCINHVFDKERTEKMVSVHNPFFKEVESKNLFYLSVNELPSPSELDSYDTIGIDEAQFFDDLSNVIKYVEHIHKRVIVAGLNGDFKREKFGSLLDLIPKCSKLDLLHACCVKCGRDADFTHKTTIKLTESGNVSNLQVDVGGIDKYIPLCRFHYLEYTK